MHRIVLALMLAALVQGKAIGQDKTAVMAPVNQFVDAFNKGDTKTAVAMCEPETSIIDEFPPHEWHGVSACTKWMNDYDADAKKNNITDGVVTLGSPRHVDVTAERAYVVVPADYVFKQNGKQVKETGSTLTIALRHGASGWRISGWAWTKN